MLTWAHTQWRTLRLIEPGMPNQNAYIESFNGALPTAGRTDRRYDRLR